MDLNHLYERHQVSLMRANTAECSAVRHAHRGLASAYAARIVAERTRLGAPQLPIAA